MFKLPHILVICFSAVFIPLYCKHLRNSSPSYVNMFFKISGIAILFFEPTFWTWEYLTYGRFDPATTLPLYLCSLFWMVLPFAIFLKPGIAKRIALSNVATIGFVGGLFGLIFNIYVNQYPFFSFVPIRSLLYHFTMLLVSCALWATGYYKPKAGDEYLCFVPFGIIMVPSLILNKLYGFDYLYTAGGIGTPLEAISSVMPRPVFLILLWGFMWFCMRLVFFRKTCYKVSEIKERAKTA